MKAMPAHALLAVDGTPKNIPVTTARNVATVELAFFNAMLAPLYDVFRAQGYCCAVSPTHKYCTRPIGHEMQQHAAGGQGGVILEAWIDGDPSCS